MIGLMVMGRSNFSGDRNVLYIDGGWGGRLLLSKLVKHMLEICAIFICKPINFISIKRLNVKKLNAYVHI